MVNDMYVDTFKGYSTVGKFNFLIEFSFFYYDGGDFSHDIRYITNTDENTKIDPDGLDDVIKNELYAITEKYIVDHEADYDF